MHNDDAFVIYVSMLMSTETTHTELYDTKYAVAVAALCVVVVVSCVVSCLSLCQCVVRLGLCVFIIPVALPEQDTGGASTNKKCTYAQHTQRRHRHTSAIPNKPLSP